MDQDITGLNAGGQKIEDLNIRTLTGVSITTIIRGETVIPNPYSSEIIRPQDTIIVIGSNEQIKIS